MARVVLSLSCETELVTDCIADLQRAHEALTHRHGAAFRDLERRIEQIEPGDGDGFDFPEIEPGRMVMTPPPRWVALVAEARALGVI
jgi:hypothetical protein